MHKSHLGIPASRYKEEQIIDKKGKQRFLSEEEEEPKENRSSSPFSIEKVTAAIEDQNREGTEREET